MKERKPGLIGAIAYWGFDIATLWTCFHAFGTPPPVAVIVMAYVVGVLANALPLPGGLGGVEGGMFGAFLAFGTPSSLAILAVLSYRLISFWLPTLPGAAAYLQLRRTIGHWRDETQRQPVTRPVPGSPHSEAAGADRPDSRNKDHVGAAHAAQAPVGRLLDEMPRNEMGTVQTRRSAVNHSL